MKTRYGLGVGLTGLLGAAIATGGLSAALSGGVGITQQPGPCVANAPVAGCIPGTLTITKDVSGTGTIPSSGWDFTVTSSCLASPVQMNIPWPAGATSQSVTNNAIGPVYANANQTPCQYTVTEATYAGWSAGYSPSATVAMTPGKPGPFVIVTNTAVVVPPVVTPSVVTPSAVTPPPVKKAFPRQSRTGV